MAPQHSFLQFSCCDLGVWDKEHHHTLSTLDLLLRTDSFKANHTFITIDSWQPSSTCETI